MGHPFSKAGQPEKTKARKIKANEWVTYYFDLIAPLPFPRQPITVARRLIRKPDFFREPTSGSPRDFSHSRTRL
jgi:hypothetical protein